MRGGEKVLEALCEIYPDADIYTHVYDAGAISAEINKHKIYTTFINKLPWARRLYQKYLPLMPFALGRLDLSDYDLVISCESGPAKGVSLPPGIRHVCYCHTPMRYLWDMYEIYRKNAGWLTAFFMRVLVPWLRRWDIRTASGVDVFVANSRFVQQRIHKIYGRESQVIYPPVPVNDFEIAPAEDFYLYAGELTQYKQPQLALEAFNQSGRNLIVIGDGDLKNELKKMACSNIRFMDWLPTEQLHSFFSRCKALIFPGIEDFGIVPVEVMASGRPVIAFRAGGALETVTEGVTGVFFNEQTAVSLNSALDHFEQHFDQFQPEVIKANMDRFSKSRFRNEFLNLLENWPVSGK